MIITLRPYQQDGIDRVLEAERRGDRRQLGVAATGLGKASPVSEPVLMPGGWQPIGELEPGDQVIGVDGKPTEILGVYPQGIKPVMRVTFQDGSWARCCPEHLWTVRTKYDRYRRRPWRTMTTTDIALSRQDWQIPLVAPVHHDHRSLPVDPYTLGVLLGDGCVGCPRELRVCTDEWIWDRLGLPGHIVERLDSGYTIAARIKDPSLNVALQSLGLWGKRSWEKHLPPIYLLGTPADRLAVLRGLMDTDGHPMVDGGAEFSSTAESLVLAVAELVRSLGGVARNITDRVTSYTHNGEKLQGRRSWRVNIKMPADACPFLLPRKAERWRPPTKYPPARVIRSIEPDGPDVEQVCIRVANPDGLYVTRDHIVTHNTVMFTALAERRRGRTLVLAHRDELISQAAGKMAEVWPELGVTAATRAALRSSDHPAADAPINPEGIGIVKAAADDVRAHVVVASVQTLARPARLERLTGAISSEGSLLTADVEPFNLVVVDEAHHAVADTYRRILTELRAGEDDGPLLLGVTATPDRGDGKGLDGLFHSVAFNYDILFGIQSGYLSDVRGRAVKVRELDVSKIKTTAGDYQAGDAGRALEEAGGPAVIARAIVKHAKDRRTLVFTPTVATATEVAAECIGLGLVAEWVSGETDQDERRRILRDYAAGRIQVLANCAVLTEGFDDPGIGCVVVGRPTKSRALYAQMVGRGTRRHPEKNYCLVLDVVGAADEHSLITIPSLFGLDGKRRTAARNGSRSVAEMADEHAREQRHIGEVIAESVELFHKIRTGGIAWLPTHSRSAPRKRYVRPMPKDDRGREYPTVVLSQMEQGADVWTAGLEWPSTGAQRPLIRRVPMETAQGVAEDAVRALTAQTNADALVTTDADWRAKPPSSRLLRHAKNWHVTVQAGWTAGQVSDEINTRAAKAAARKAAKLRESAMAEQKGA